MADTTSCSTKSCTHTAKEVVNMNSADFSQHLVLAAHDRTGQRARDLSTAGGPIVEEPKGRIFLLHKAASCVLLEKIMTERQTDQDDCKLLTLTLLEMNSEETMSGIRGYKTGDDFPNEVTATALQKAMDTVTACMAAIHPIEWNGSEESDDQTNTTQ